MAVHAQHPSNILLLNRNEQERKNNMEYTLQQQTPQSFLAQSNPFFPIAGSSNTRKRARDANPTPTQYHHSPINLFSDQSPPSTLVDLPRLQLQWQEQHNKPDSMVSTGLRLSFEEQEPTTTPLLHDELATQLDHHKDEIYRFIQTQEDHLRRTLAELRGRHYRALIISAEETLSRRLREKDEVLVAAARRNSELEERVARLREESAALQAKARADEAVAAALRSQLQEATAAAVDDWAASDAESSCVDPRRAREETSVLRRAMCRSCHRRTAAAVVLPCRHLCLCVACAAATGGELCPVCCGVRSACVEVYLS